MDVEVNVRPDSSKFGLVSCHLGVVAVLKSGILQEIPADEA